MLKETGMDPPIGQTDCKSAGGNRVEGNRVDGGKGTTEIVNFYFTF